jgi:hypothetical protein
MMQFAEYSACDFIQKIIKEDLYPFCQVIVDMYEVTLLLLINS